MRIAPRRIFIGLLVLAAAGILLATRSVGSRGRGPTRLEYTVRVSDADSGVLDVLLRATGSSSSSLFLAYLHGPFVSANPAQRYRVREAHDEKGRALELRPDGQGWRVPWRGSSVEVRYQVYLQEGRTPGAFTDEVLSHCDADGARLVGGDVFLFPPHSEPESVEVRYELPEGWKLVHPFQSGPDRAVYPSLRALYHSAAALGDYRVLERDAADCQMTVAVRGDFRFSDRDLLDVVGGLARKEILFFGKPLRPRYLFVVDPHPASSDERHFHYFGLHFDASMILLIDADTDRDRLNVEPAQLCAHEFFHNWNGELIGQNEYDMNWFVEGVTTFYAYQMRLEAGMLSFGQYADELQRRYGEEYLANGLRGQLSVADAGRSVLVDPQRTRLLYAGGLFTAAALDLAIDEASGQSASLDDLMRRLVLRAESEEDFLLTRESLMEELRRLTGEDFGAWLDAHVYGTVLPRLPDYITRGNDRT